VLREFYKTDVGLHGGPSCASVNSDVWCDEL